MHRLGVEACSFGCPSQTYQVEVDYILEEDKTAVDHIGLGRVEDLGGVDCRHIDQHHRKEVDSVRSPVVVDRIDPVVDYKGSATVGYMGIVMVGYRGFGIVGCMMVLTVEDMGSEKADYTMGYRGSVEASSRSLSVAVACRLVVTRFLHNQLVCIRLEELRLYMYQMNPYVNNQSFGTGSGVHVP